MPTLVMDPAPAEIDALIEYRRRLDLDHYDEVVGGVLHMNPPPTGEHQYVLQQLDDLLGPLARQASLVPLMNEFGLGREGKDNYRVPDGGLHRAVPRGVYQGTAALVIEIVVSRAMRAGRSSPYAAHEMMRSDRRPARALDQLAGTQERRVPTDRAQRSDHLGPDDLAEQIDWP